MRKMIFICSPYRGDVAKNRQRAIDLCKYAITKNFLPVAPHLIFPSILDDNKLEERRIGLECSLQLLGKCSSMWLDERTGITEGMRLELDFAERMGMKIIRIGK